MLARFLALGLSKVLDRIANPILKLLPRIAIESVAELTVAVHFSPTISTPFTTCHVDKEIAVRSLIVNLRIFPIFATGTRRKAVDLALWNKCDMRSNPGLIHVQVLERILLFVLPIHVFLFVADGIPPDVQ